MQKGNLWNTLKEIITDIKIQQVADILRHMSFHAKETEGPMIHQHVEIIYVKEGSCILHIANESISFKQGEFMIIGSNVSHTIEAGKYGVTPIQLEFHPELFRETSMRTEELVTQMNTLFVEFSPVIRISSDHRIENAIQNIIYELSNKKPYCQYLAVMYYAELFALFNRFLTERYIPMCNNKCIKKAIIYIRNNYMKDISINDVAESSDVSERYLRKLFAQYLQISPLEYINQVRINKAIELLKNEDCSIKEISIRCGFQTPQYFSRVFKQHTGSCPRNITNFK